MTNTQLAASVDPAKVKAIARAVLGLVAMFIPQAAWVRLLAALLDMLAMESQWNPGVAAALADLPRTNQETMDVAVLEAYNR